MKESTKRIMDCLAFLVLGVPAAIFWFDYTNNRSPSKIWIVLSSLDVPFAIAALIWFGWRLLKGESTKRVIDWLTLVPLGFMPASMVCLHYWHIDQPPTIWVALLIIDIPLALTSIIWLILREDKIRIVRWIRDIAQDPALVLLFCLACLLAAVFVGFVFGSGR